MKRSYNSEWYTRYILILWNENHPWRLRLYAEKDISNQIISSFKKHKQHFRFLSPESVKGHFWTISGNIVSWTAPRCHFLYVSYKKLELIWAGVFPIKATKLLLRKSNYQIFITTLASSVLSLLIFISELSKRKAFRFKCVKHTHQVTELRLWTADILFHQAMKMYVNKEFYFSRVFRLIIDVIVEHKNGKKKNLHRETLRWDIFYGRSDERAWNSIKFHESCRIWNKRIVLLTLFLTTHRKYIVKCVSQPTNTISSDRMAQMNSFWSYR